MKILYYELKSILIKKKKKIRKLLLEHIYSQTGELWNKHPITPPSAKPRTVVSSTLTKIVRGKGPFDDANIRGLLLDSKSMTYERPTKGTPAIHPNPIDNIESECP